MLTECLESNLGAGHFQGGFTAVLGSSQLTWGCQVSSAPLPPCSHPDRILRDLLDSSCPPGPLISPASRPPHLSPWIPLISPAGHITSPRLTLNSRWSPGYSQTSNSPASVSGVYSPTPTYHFSFSGDTSNLSHLLLSSQLLCSLSLPTVTQGLPRCSRPSPNL